MKRAFAQALVRKVPNASAPRHTGRTRLAVLAAAFVAFLAFAGSASAALAPASYTLQARSTNANDCVYSSSVGLDMEIGTAGLTNAGFEAGNTSGWAGTGQAVTQYISDNGTVLNPKHGSYFGVVRAGCPTNQLTQSFSATEGTTLSGWSFFQAEDYWPYDDNGQVQIVAVGGGGEPIVLFSSSLCQVGTNYGGTGWVAWTYTFTDSDGDGTADPGPNTGTQGKPDFDGDGQIDECDYDDDADTVTDVNDAFPLDPTETKDSDGDKVGDNADAFPYDPTKSVADSDGDGDADDVDNCPTTANADQADMDSDDTGDACDPDIDGDGDLNAADNCLTTANADQADTDGDGTGDACDSLTYSWSGFFRPIDNKDANGNYILNRVKAGSAVPVKFSLGGNRGLDIFQAGYPASAVIQCNSQADSDSVEETVNAGGSSLSYDALTDTYTYVWKTVKTWSGCRQLVVKTADGGQHRANFQLTK